MCLGGDKVNNYLLIHCHLGRGRRLVITMIQPLYGIETRIPEYFDVLEAKRCQLSVEWTVNNRILTILISINSKIR